MRWHADSSSRTNRMLTHGGSEFVVPNLFWQELSGRCNSRSGLCGQGGSQQLYKLINLKWFTNKAFDLRRIDRRYGHAAAISAG